MLKPKSPFVAGQLFIHQCLWDAARVLLSHSESKSRMEFRMAGMVMAYFCYEAHLNRIGLVVDREAWKDERQFFAQEPYRGTEGKLKRICEQTGIDIEFDKRPYLTVRDLGRLRNLLAHGKRQPYSYKAKGKFGKGPDTFRLKLHRMVSVKKADDALQDTQEFLEELYKKIREKRAKDGMEFKLKAFDYIVASGLYI